MPWEGRSRDAEPHHPRRPDSRPRRRRRSPPRVVCDRRGGGSPVRGVPARYSRGNASERGARGLGRSRPLRRPRAVALPGAGRRLSRSDRRAGARRRAAAGRDRVLEPRCEAPLAETRPAPLHAAAPVPRFGRCVVVRVLRLRAGSGRMVRAPSSRWRRHPPHRRRCPGLRGALREALDAPRGDAGRPRRRQGVARRPSDSPLRPRHRHGCGVLRRPHAADRDALHRDRDRRRPGRARPRRRGPVRCRGPHSRRGPQEAEGRLHPAPVPRPLRDAGPPRVGGEPVEAPVDGDARRGAALRRG